MALTQTSGMTASVVTQYEKEYLYMQDMATTWAKFLYPHMIQEVVGGKELRGTTVQVPLYTDLAEVTTSLTETSDVTPVSMLDGYVQVTIAEEGNVLQNTRLLEDQSMIPLAKVVARNVAKNMAVRRDKVIRNAIVFNVTDIIRGSIATRALSTTATNPITRTLCAEAVARARSRGVPALPDGTYFTIYNPALETELAVLTEVTNIGYYNQPSVILDGTFKGLNTGMKLPGETYRIADLRFIPSQYGKVFVGAGLPKQAATTLTGAHAAGSTTIEVGANTGFAVGEYLTVGTLESSTTAYHVTEQVRITAINSTTISIYGAGKEGDPDDTGLKFAHANGVSVIESENICALPIMGPESVIVAYSSTVGWEGEFGTTPAPTQLPGRFINHWWYWVGGAKIVDKNCVQLEVPTQGKILGNS